jgi:hypothetical protein
MSRDAAKIPVGLRIPAVPAFLNTKTEKSRPALDRCESKVTVTRGAMFGTSLHHN